MKRLLKLIFILFISVMYSQEEVSKNLTLVFKKIKSDTCFVVMDFKFEVNWNSKLSYSENIGYYGGIEKIKIYKFNKLINQYSNIEDVTGLSAIIFRFYDYNQDSYLDFSLPLASGKKIWLKYYFFNTKTHKFRHVKELDYEIFKLKKG